LDDAAVAALPDRDPTAVAACYEALADPLFRFVRSRCADGELAADIVEATFVELLHAAPRLEGGVGGLRRWLFTAARHNLLDEQRKQRRRGDAPLSVEAGADGGDVATGDRAPDPDGERGQPGHADPGATPEEQLAAAERDAEVRRALAQLPADQREVLELRFAGELSAGEIGEVMGRSPGAVRVLQHRALKALGGVLGEHPDAAADQVAGRVGDAADHAVAARPRGPPPPRD
jgi:RNA polymerase sigma-70 factor (ECF subfamily)